jgi:hypothetical protein
MPELVGSCPGVAVSGTGHVVSIETVDRIDVVGAGHVVTYQHGVLRNAPTVNISGSGNSVLRAGSTR